MAYKQLTFIQRCRIYGLIDEAITAFSHAETQGLVNEVMSANYTNILYLHKAYQMAIRIFDTFLRNIPSIYETDVYSGETLLNLDGFNYCTTLLFCQKIIAERFNNQRIRLIVGNPRSNDATQPPVWQSVIDFCNQNTIRWLQDPDNSGCVTLHPSDHSRHQLYAVSYDQCTNTFFPAKDNLGTISDEVIEDISTNSLTYQQRCII